jgi:hypothetical protein
MAGHRAAAAGDQFVRRRRCGVFSDPKPFVITSLLVLGTAPVGHAAPGAKDKGPAYYFPSTVGDRLEFEATPDGKPQSGFVLEVLEVETKGRAVVVTVSNDAPEIGRLTFQYRLTESGVEQLKSGETAYATPIPLLRLPAKEGDAWEWTHPIPKTKRSYKTVKEEVVEVPAGKFKAVRVECVIDGEGTYIDWYAPGLGSIKRETSRPLLGNGVRVLKSFTPGKK